MKNSWIKIIYSSSNNLSFKRQDYLSPACLSIACSNPFFQVLGVIRNNYCLIIFIFYYVKIRVSTCFLRINIYVKNYEIINLNNKNNVDNISTICAISRFLIISLQYLYLLENVDFTLFFAIYLMIYSILLQF